MLTTAASIRTTMTAVFLLLLGMCVTLPSANAAPAGPMSRIPGAESLAQPIQSRMCRSCRNACYNEYRRYCGYSESCRSGFTACMRECWYEVCR